MTLLVVVRSARVDSTTMAAHYRLAIGPLLSVREPERPYNEEERYRDHRMTRPFPHRFRIANI